MHNVFWSGIFHLSDTDNFESEQNISNFVAHQVFKLKTLEGYFAINYILKFNSVSCGNNTTSLITEGNRTLQGKAADSVARGCPVPLWGEACMAQWARPQAGGQTAAFSSWTGSKHDPVLTTASVHPLHTYAVCYSRHKAVACRGATMDCWVPHKLWNTPDLATRTWTHAREPMLPRMQASSQHRISSGNCKLHIGVAILATTLKEGISVDQEAFSVCRAWPPYPYHHAGGSGLLCRGITACSFPVMGRKGLCWAIGQHCLSLLVAGVYCCSHLLAELNYRLLRSLPIPVHSLFLRGSCRWRDDIILIPA